jgi:DNA-binding response OmpR family regulator
MGQRPAVVVTGTAGVEAVDRRLVSPGGAQLHEPSVVVAAGDGVEGAILVGLLRRHGFRVHEMTDGAAAASATGRAEVALVDTGLRDRDPFRLVAELRRAGLPTAVIGGRQAEERAAAEAEGADAYLVRPVVAAEVVSTLRLLALRPPMDVVLTSGPLVIDVGRRHVRVGDRRVHLAPREFELLTHLASSPGQVFGVDELLRDVWHTESRPRDAGTVAVHIRRIRQKLEAAGMPRFIETVKGRGYAFLQQES